MSILPGAPKSGVIQARRKFRMGNAECVGECVGKIAVRDRLVAGSPFSVNFTMSVDTNESGP